MYFEISAIHSLVLSLRKNSSIKRSDVFNTWTSFLSIRFHQIYCLISQVFVHLLFSKNDEAESHNQMYGSIFRYTMLWIDALPAAAKLEISYLINPASSIISLSIKNSSMISSSVPKYTCGHGLSFMFSSVYNEMLSAYQLARNFCKKSRLNSCRSCL